LRARIEMGDKFTSSLSSAGELVLLIQDFSLADVGQYKVIVENELGAISEIIRMEMSGNSISPSIIIIIIIVVVVVTIIVITGRWHTAFLAATKHRLIQPRGQIRARSLP